MAEISYETVQTKLAEQGFTSLTPAEKEVLKYGGPEENKMINTDAYDAADVDMLNYKQAAGIPLDNEEKTVMYGKEIDNKNDLVNMIIHGQNDLWHHDYDYTEDGGPKFTISIQIPNILEQGQIKARVQQYLGGTAMYWDEYTVAVYTALATIRVCGRQVPDVFKDDAKIYAVTSDWLYQINQDFEEFQSRFRY